MLTDDEKEFDELWSEMKSRLYFTLQSEGVDFYTLENRSNMAWDLRFHDGLNTEYITKKHGASIRGIASLLEWADMHDFELEQDRQKMEQDNKSQILQSNEMQKKCRTSRSSQPQTAPF